MKIFEEDYQTRVENNRRKQIYKEMLDQQVRYNQQRAMNSHQKPRKRETDPNAYFGDHPSQSNQGYQKNYARQRQNYSYLPYLNSKNNEKHQKPAEGVDSSTFHLQNCLREIDDDDRTEVYLNNCEEIIKNLRDLKDKKKNRQSWISGEGRVKSEGIFQQNPQARLPRRDFNKNELYFPESNYYPKASYFSSVGSPYNKNVGSTGKSSTIQTPKNNRYLGLSKKKIKNQQIVRKGVGIQPASKPDSRSLRKKRQLSGILKLEKEVNPEDLPKKILKKLKVASYQFGQESQQPRGLKDKKVNTPEGSVSRVVNDSRRQDDQRRIRELQLQKERDSHNQQLSDCLKELTKFLKNQNKQTDQLKKSMSELQKVDSQEKKRKNVQISGLQMDSNSRINQYEIKQEVVQKESEQQSVERITRLKNAVISGLRKLNKKSLSFLEKIEGINERVSPFGKIQQKSAVNGYQKKVKPQQQNIELMRLLVKTINEQDGHNHELVERLRELAEYFKRQNEEQENEEHRYSRLSIKQEKIETNSKEKGTQSRSKSRKKLDPEQQKEKQEKLKEAILRRLKKARQRGNIFKQKVENFKKHKAKQGQKSRIDEKDEKNEEQRKETIVEEIINGALNTENSAI